ncbi:ABC transporter ATP-binding protein [bacterium]|nr:ABC transporter ATP-binding protein [bacterium]
MIEVRALDFAYPGGAPVLAGLDFALAPGEKALLLGANGAGKSTLLKLLDGLLYARAGEIRYAGRRLERAAFAERAFRRRFRAEVGLLFQRPETMFFNPTVRDEIAFGPRQLGLADAGARAEHWARALDLAAQLERPPFALSGGQQQRLGLACLFALEPKLLLLDEPSAHLDPPATGWLVDALAASPAAVLVSTHRLGLAPELGTHALLLSPAGRLLYDGPVAPLLADGERLLAAGLLHRHAHRHGELEHRHYHAHDWD